MEAATVPFDVGARKINHDWGTTLDGKQIQRWSERIGDRLVGEREAALELFEKKNILPGCKANEHELLVIGMDGGRVQNRLKNQDGSRWREDKVLTVTSYLKGDGKELGRLPQKLVSSYLATMGDAEDFGRLARLESERRGIRQAEQTIVIGDGASWIDGLCERHFPRSQRIVDWYHAVEHLYEAARAAHPTDDSAAKELAERMKSLLWEGGEGKFDELMTVLRGLSATAGDPPAMAMETDPRKVLRRTVGYFEKRRGDMDYPRYRANGWPIGSGVTESGVKLFNKRVKGTEQFWSTPGVEAILALRAAWLSDDETPFHNRLCPPRLKLAA